jgi:FAD/FMN-containing dehydrogenase
MREELSAEVDGEILTPDNDGYDEARAVWNGRFDRRPALIVRCTSAHDVAAAVRFARTRGLEISVKSGGHDYAGNTVGDGGHEVVDGQAVLARKPPSAATENEACDADVRYGARRRSQAVG